MWLVLWGSAIWLLKFYYFKGRRGNEVDIYLCQFCIVWELFVELHNMPVSGERAWDPITHSRRKSEVRYSYQTWQKKRIWFKSCYFHQISDIIWILQTWNSWRTDPFTRRVGSRSSNTTESREKGNLAIRGKGLTLYHFLLLIIEQ